MKQLGGKIKIFKLKGSAVKRKNEY